MKQLTMGVVLQLAIDLKQRGMTAKEVAELPIYIGNDDELNGIHTAWYTQLMSSENTDDETFIEMINEDYCNIKFKDKAILIS